MAKAIFDPEDVQKIFASAKEAPRAPQNLEGVRLRNSLQGVGEAFEDAPLAERTFQRYLALILGLLKPLLSTGSSIEGFEGVPNLRRAFPLRGLAMEELLLKTPVIWDAVSGEFSVSQEKTVEFVHTILEELNKGTTGAYGSLAQRDFISFYLKELSFMEKPQSYDFYLSTFAAAFDTVVETLFQVENSGAKTVKLSVINPLELKEMLVIETVKKEEKKKVKSL